jgi:hypothetical protein
MRTVIEVTDEEDGELARGEIGTVSPKKRDGRIPQAHD